MAGSGCGRYQGSARRASLAAAGETRMDTTIQPVQTKPKLLDQLPHVFDKRSTASAARLTACNLVWAVCINRAEHCEGFQ